MVRIASEKVSDQNEDYGAECRGGFAHAAVSVKGNRPAGVSGAPDIAINNTTLYMSRHLLQ